jgi:hypothetical protein
MTTAEDTVVSQVKDWRYEALIRAGAEACDAAIIAENMKVDLHLAVHLIKDQNCPSQLAREILT